MMPPKVQGVRSLDVARMREVCGAVRLLIIRKSIVVAACVAITFVEALSPLQAFERALYSCQRCCGTVARLFQAGLGSFFHVLSAAMCKLQVPTVLPDPGQSSNACGSEACGAKRELL